MKIILENLEPNKNYNNFDKRNKVIIYGANELGRKIAQNLKFSSKLELFCYVDDDKSLSNQLLSSVIIHDIAKINSLIEKNNIDLVIYAKNEKELIADNQIINDLIKNKIKIKIIDDFDIFTEDVKLTNLKDLDYEYSLNRPEFLFEDHKKFNEFINKNILITGSGGSIGSEISRQILKIEPKKLFLVEHSELSLFNVYNSLMPLIDNKKTILKPILSNVCDETIIENIFENEEIDIVFHCAAYKHVDMVEKNQVSGLINNIKSTIITSNLSSKYNIEKYVLISSDKAVFPSTLMGASKRLSEIYIQSLQNKVNNKTSFSAVRFGNVLNSSGSVIPIFKEQILSGGPVTVRDKNVTRYFMTIFEAVNLVIFTTFISQPGKIYILDMGQPIKIIDLAKQMIKFYGFNYNLIQNNSKKIQDNKSIDIVITALKKTEKLHEELLINKENFKIVNNKIFEENVNYNFDYNIIDSQINQLISFSNEFNYKKMYEIIKNIIKDHKLLF